MLPQELLIVVGKTTTLVCGGFVASLAYRAYLRTRSPALRALAYGLAYSLYARTPGRDRDPSAAGGDSVGR
jgi:hypothetical protein